MSEVSDLSPESTAQKSSDYNASSISVLKGLEAVRKRPGMYIGDVSDGTGLHHMVYEVADNSVDEALAGHCDTINITLHPDGYVSVEDNGRGMPVDIHPEEGVSAAELIMTKLHAGGKFNQNSYKVAGGLHGVGVSVVNALSSDLILTVYRDGQEHEMRFSHGEVTSDIKAIKKIAKSKTGTKVCFKPSDDAFDFTEFNYKTLQKRFRETCFLNAGLRVILSDERGEEAVSDEFQFEGGVREFVKHISPSQEVIGSEPIFVNGEKDGIEVQVSLQWNHGSTEKCLCFTNNIPQADGGTHLAGFRAALTRTLTNYTNTNKLLKRGESAFTGDDIREGLTSVISVKVPDPKFSSQTKNKLVSSEVRPAVEQIMAEELNTWLEEHPAEAKEIISRASLAANAREAARKARELVRRKTDTDISSLPGKLADCQSRKPEECEIFIVEGDSAGGSAKQARQRYNQAILPLKGKILNVERTDFGKVLNSAEVGTLAKALGAFVQEGRFNTEKLRYHKIVIMTDADVDGSHIRTLLLTFFFRHMPELIENGYVYIAQPPLYKLKRGQSELYLLDDTALTNHLLEEGISNISLSSNGKMLDQVEQSELIEACKPLAECVKQISLISGNEALIDALVGAGAMKDDLFFDPHVIKSRLDDAMSFLNSAPEQAGVTWSYKREGFAPLVFLCERDGVIDEIEISSNIKAARGYQIVNKGPNIDLLAFLDGNGALVNKSGDLTPLRGPSHLIGLIMNIASRGISVQRYKGLGEMNPDQLWETTLDPEARTLVQVKIEDAEMADEMVTTFLGSETEARKRILQSQSIDAEGVDA